MVKEIAELKEIPIKKGIITLNLILYLFPMKLLVPGKTIVHGGTFKQPLVHPVLTVKPLFKFRKLASPFRGKPGIGAAVGYCSHRQA